MILTSNRAWIGPFLALNALLLLNCWACADEEIASVAPCEGWSAVFVDQKIEFSYTLTVPKAFKGRGGWTLTAHDRVLAHGSLALPSEAQKPATSRVQFELTQNREGVVVQALLSVAVYADGREKPEAKHDRTVWLFPRDPFAQRT